MELLTAAQMREIEQAAIASGAVTGLELMERAGRGVVEAIWEEWPELRAISGRAVVLCGPGNNGGDGFVVARLLKEWGWEVEVFLYGDPEKLPPDARVNYDRWGEMGEVKELGFPTVEPDAADEFSLHASHEIDVQKNPRTLDKRPFIVVDGLFGTGLARPLNGLGPITTQWDYLALFRDLNNSRLVCIDIPSGLCSDSGQVLGIGTSEADVFPVLPADLTVAFHAPKLGHFLSSGPAFSGKLAVCDIGLQHGAMSSLFEGSPRTADPDTVTLVSSEKQIASPLGKSSKGGLHKYEHGSAFICSGGVARGGAARLAARGALRMGAGLVTVGCPPSALMENASVLNAIMVRRIEDGAALATMLESDARVNALCLGPGMGTGEREAGIVSAALSLSAKKEIDPEAATLSEMRRYLENSYTGLATVLDADALTLLSRDQSIFQLLHDRCVLTPHAGEFARLFPDIAEKLAAPATKGPAYSKVDATREAAKRAGCVVLFKGPDTVIADPSGRCSINAAVYDRAAPWLATAGSGDVLAGFITGLLARGFPPMQAAETGAWLHVECARSFGPGLIAEDLPEELPKVFRTLGL